MLTPSVGFSFGSPLLSCALFCQILWTINFRCRVNYFYTGTTGQQKSPFHVGLHCFLFGHLFHMTAKSPSDAQLALVKLPNDAQKASCPGRHKVAVCDLLCNTLCVCVFGFLINHSSFNCPWEPSDRTDRNKGSVMDRIHTILFCPSNWFPRNTPQQNLGPFFKAIKLSEP